MADKTIKLTEFQHATLIKALKSHEISASVEAIMARKDGGAARRHHTAVRKLVGIISKAGTDGA